jgi:hypothetical protein
VTRTVALHQLHITLYKPLKADLAALSAPAINRRHSCKSTQPIARFLNEHLSLPEGLHVGTEELQQIFFGANIQLAWSKVSKHVKGSLLTGQIQYVCKTLFRSETPGLVLHTHYFQSVTDSVLMYSVNFSDGTCSLKQDSAHHPLKQ